MTRASDTAKLLGAGGSILGSLDVGGGQIGGRRNIAINGAMNVAQRSASVTGIGAAAGYFTLDRWNITPSGTAGRLTMTQTADGPSGVSANCMKLDCTTADASIAAGEYLVLQQKFEGQDLQSIGKGVAGAKEFTVSFYVKANAAFDFVCELYDTDNGRIISRLFSTTTGWARHEFTFPADVDDGSSPFDDDNAASLQLNFWLHGGSDFTSGTLNATAWTNATNTNRAVGIDSFFSSTDNNFFITGVQMEVGSVATPFEHRSYGEELALCKRYFQNISNGELWGSTNTTARMRINAKLSPDMRVAPTIARLADTTVTFQGSAAGKASTSTTAAQGATTSTTSLGFDLGGFSSLGDRAYAGANSAVLVFTADSEL